MEKDEKTPQSFLATAPTNILEDNNLTPHSRLLYITISSLTMKKGFCYAGNVFLAEKFNVTTISISKWISELEKYGYIVTKAKQSKYRKIYITGRGWPTLTKNLKSTLNEDLNRGLYLEVLPKGNTKPKQVSAQKRRRALPEINKARGIVKKYNRNFLVEYWNSMKYTPHHKRPETKVYRECIDYFKALRNGTFHKKTDQPNLWLTNVKIPKSWYEKKYTDKELKAMLNNLGLLYTPGTWPKDKSRLPRSLSKLIYNPVSRKSMLLYCKKHPPKPLAENLYNGDYKDKDMQKIWLLLHNVLFDTNGSVDLSESGFNLDKAVKELMLCHKELPKDKHGEIKRMFPTPVKMTDKYCAYIKSSYHKKIKSIWLLPHRFLFQGFLDTMSESTGVSFITGKDIE